MIVLGTLILIIIAVAAGVGGGAARATAKKNAHKEASESKPKKKPQGSSTPTSSPYAPQNYKTCSSLIEVLTWRQNSPSPTSGDAHPPVVTVTSSISSSPTPTPIRKNTPLAAVNLDSGSVQLFYKHTDASIRFRENDGSKWEEESLQITGLKPRDDSGFAAVSWFYNNIQQA